MHISQLLIKNFCSFQDEIVEFHPGLNVLIGENNSGKTTILRALNLMFDSNRKRPTVHDFYTTKSLSVEAPAITIGVILRSDQQDKPDDFALVATWLTQLTEPWEARLTYSFTLPEKEQIKFQAEMELLSQEERHRHYKHILERYIPKYIVTMTAGNPDNPSTIESADLNRFQSQFLKAIRDAESEMFRGNDPLLRRMLPYILDYDLSSEEKTSNQQEFQAKIRTAIDHLRERMQDDALFSFIQATGAGDGGQLVLRNDTIDERDLLSIMRLAVKITDDDDPVTIPLTHNGLGYNNLVYIALLLREMEISTDQETVGQNAIVFPMLLIEEPEAHLHPALQYRLLKWLKERVQENTQCRQIFLSTHSSHITAACKLDEIIHVSAPPHTPRLVYLRKVFADTKEDQQSKRFLERFLDATKSNMLFARRVLFVEGVAEQLVLPQLATMLGRSFEQDHVALVVVNGVTVGHFLKLFQSPSHSNVIHRPIACLCDADPQEKEATHWKESWPLLANNATRYRPKSFMTETLHTNYDSHEHIKIFSGCKTFEYDLALENYNELGFVDIHKNSNLISDIEMFFNDSSKRKLLWNKIPASDKKKSLLLDEYIQSLIDNSYDNHVFATWYLIINKDKKGENAYDIASELKELNDQGRLIRIPQHIRAAIEWVCPSVINTRKK